LKATAEDLRYPIGTPKVQSRLDARLREQSIFELAEAPALLRRVVAGLTDAQLDTPYRDGGWTVRQVIHHVADSHMNSYVRFRLALTEDNPTIKPYNEAAWAQLPDASTLPVEVSLQLLDGIHRRLVDLLRGLPEEKFARTFQHPERGPMTLDANVALYAWHGRHHAAHVEALRKRNGW